MQHFINYFNFNNYCILTVVESFGSTTLYNVLFISPIPFISNTFFLSSLSLFHSSLRYLFAFIFLYFSSLSHELLFIFSFFLFFRMRLKLLKFSGP